MRYFFTNRYGGVSKKPYDSLNLGQHVGDNIEFVEQNRAILKEKVGASKLVFMNQVHGDKVAHILDGNEEPTCDAMICNRPNIGLCVMVADCLPILFYDKKNSAIGVAHAGSVGTALGIGKKTVLAMQETFETKAEDLFVWIGAGIGACCYEVKKEATVGLEEALRMREGRYFLDLKSYNEAIFREFGVWRIEVSSLCSCCEESLFSYRREGVTGRFVGVIAL